MRRLKVLSLLTTVLFTFSITNRVFAAVMDPNVDSTQVPIVALPREKLVKDQKGNLIPDYYGTANWAYSPPLRKFVDALPGLGQENKNALGQYIPIAVPDTTTYPGSDYYEIAVVE